MSRRTADHGNCFGVPAQYAPCIVLLLLIAVASSGCGTLGFYSQAVFGHLDLVKRRVPVVDVINDPDTPIELKEKLTVVSEVREFATRELALPDNDSYRSYADLERRFVVWNVFATPPLSLEPVQSCYLFVGCLSYRGYFAESDAQHYARRLQDDGYDVYLGGVAAYSTLGWFSDPVLNTMLYWDDQRIARVIFHELTHQLLYVRDDALFNESFATSFADIGLRRWFAARSSKAASEFERGLRRDREFLELILETRTELETVFDADYSDQEKLKRKRLIYAELRERYEDYKRRWQGYSDYDEWMSANLNNAKIASVVTYYSYEKAFARILAEANNDIPRFIERVRQIAALDKTSRHECLEQYSGASEAICAISP